MNNYKACLFTAHSPSIGGGSVILRSLIKHLPELPVTWKYIARAKVTGYEEGYLGNGFMGSGIVNDLWQSWKMLADLPSKDIDHIVEKLLAVDCDCYWIVSHNEGIRVALELSRRQTSRPVHLTIHDDWQGALCARSSRYRLWSGLAKKMTIKTLQTVNDFDVISRGMQTYYEQISGVRGGVCHRYLSPAVITGFDTAYGVKPEIRVGHIGSVYDSKMFFEFVYLLKEFAKANGVEAVMHMWGYHDKKNRIPADIKTMIHIHPDLPEAEAVPLLAQLHFVYAMYPMSRRLKLFSSTSLPTKLSTYVQSGRPIFGHAPGDSTLTEFINSTNTGVIWSNGSLQTGKEAIDRILNLLLKKEVWDKARNLYFGENNLTVMRNYFS